MRRPLSLATLALLVGALAGCDTGPLGFAGIAPPADSTTTSGTAAPLLMTPGAVNLRLGDTLRLAISGNQGATLAWRSTDPGIVTVRTVSGATATVLAVGTGTASVIAAVAADTGRRAAAIITVTQ
jgi:hypothetical protein